MHNIILNKAFYHSVRRSEGRYAGVEKIIMDMVIYEKHLSLSKPQ
jgi:hypothetical protein